MSNTANAAAQNPSTQQASIFDWFRCGSGNLLVRARAGTGKTTTILAAVEFAPERAILLAALNKSIANELQARINNPRVEAKTLHGLGFKFIARTWGNLKVDDEGKRAHALAVRATDNAPDPIVKLVARLHTQAREIEPFIATKGSAQDLVDVAVRFNLVPDEEWDQEGWDLNAVCDAAFKAMCYAMEKTNVIDFADMIFLPLVHNMVRAWFDLVVIDEAQDMTAAQLTLATRCCKRGGRICVVGDDCQAIYAFRGADSGSLDRLKKSLNAKELGLTTTYRCAKLIVALAKVLVPDYECPDTAPTGEILRCDRDKMVDTAREGDFILSRTNAPLVKICMALLKRGVRARIKGRDIGRGIIALIKKLHITSVTDVDAKTNEYLAKESERAQKLTEAAREERIQFVADQVSILQALADGIATVGELIARCEDLFDDKAERQAVMCSTVHRAKGLEATNTFLLEGTFRKGAQEEDNIRYVAITRAKTRMTWVGGFEAVKVAA